MRQEKNSVLLKLKTLAWDSGLTLVPHGYSCSIGSKTDIHLQLIRKHENKDNLINSLVEIPEHVLLENRIHLMKDGFIRDIDFEIEC